MVIADGGGGATPPRLDTDVEAGIPAPVVTTKYTSVDTDVGPVSTPAPTVTTKYSSIDTYYPTGQRALLEPLVAYPPSPSGTCLPGESLYKVSGTSGIVYVHASDTASKDEVKKLAGQTGFVTKVMSPAAYAGGKYPSEVEVTAVGGEKFMVPGTKKEEAPFVPSGNIELYKVGGDSYDLVGAYADGVIDKGGMRNMGFSEDAISQAVGLGGALRGLKESKYYDSSIGGVSLGPALAAGVITESQARQIFSKADVDASLKYVEPVSYQPIGKIALGKGEKPLPDGFIQQLKSAGTMGYLLPPREPSGSFVSTQTTKWGLPTVITSEQVGLLEQSLGRAPTRAEFVSAFGEVPNLPSPYMDVPTSKLYSQLYPQYTGAKYATIEAGTSMFPAVRAAYPQVSIKEITPSEWAMTGVQAALLGYGAYSGLSPLIRAQGGIRGVAGQLATSQRGGGFVVGSKGISFSRIPPLVQTPGLVYEPVGTTLKSVGPAQRLYTGIVREGPVTLEQLVGYKPITGTKVFGEMGYRPTTIYGPLSNLPRISPSVMVSGGLKVPTSGFLGHGVFGPEIPIYPLELIRWGGGGIGTRTPLKPLGGVPSITYPSTARGTPEALAREATAKGASPITQYVLGTPIGEGFVIPRPVGVPGYTPFVIPSTFPGLTPSPIPRPWITPVTTPIVSPGISPFVSPVISPTVQPGPYTGFGPGYIPFPIPPSIPIPVPVPIPTPTPVIVIPTPVPPGGGGGGSGGGGSFWWPSFGVGGLKSSRPFVLGKGGILGIGKWKFSGFKVSGPHPLALGTTGYTWMGGKEAAWGAKREAAPKKSRGLATGGLVRVV